MLYATRFSSTRDTYPANFIPILSINPNTCLQEQKSAINVPGSRLEPKISRLQVQRVSARWTYSLTSTAETVSSNQYDTHVEVFNHLKHNSRHIYKLLYHSKLLSAFSRKNVFLGLVWFSEMIGICCPYNNSPIGLCKGESACFYTKREISFEILFKLILGIKGLMSYLIKFVEQLQPFILDSFVFPAVSNLNIKTYLIPNGNIACRTTWERKFASHPNRIKFKRLRRGENTYS
jgi:hypothetical protein